MNCTQAKDAILLHASGELDAAAQHALRRHLDGCAGCRAYASDLDTLVRVEQSSQSAVMPREEIVASILKKAAPSAPAPRARREAPNRSWIEDLLAAWRPALMYGAAAVALLLVSLRMLKRETAVVAQPVPAASASAAELAWDPGLDETLSNLDTLLVSALSDVSAESSGNGDASLDDLAAELLELEGWNI